MDKYRTLRVLPRHIMTGDLIEHRAPKWAGGERTWDVVTWIEPAGHWWTIETVTKGGVSSVQVAANSKHNIKRTGPLGLGEN